MRRSNNDVGLIWVAVLNQGSAAKVIVAVRQTYDPGVGIRVRFHAADDTFSIWTVATTREHVGRLSASSGLTRLSIEKLNTVQHCYSPMAL